MKSSRTLDALFQLFIEYMTDLSSYLDYIPYTLIFVSIILYFLPTKVPASRQAISETSLAILPSQNLFQKFRKQISLTRKTKFLLWPILALSLLIFIKITFFGVHMLMWGILYFFLG